MCGIILLLGFQRYDYLLFRYFQHGSFPLIDLYNETFPEHFYTKRTDAHHVVVQQGANITTFSIARPRPGLWYFVAFLPRETEKNFRIQQKVIGSLRLNEGV